MAITLDFTPISDLEQRRVVIQAKCDRWLSDNQNYAQSLLLERGDNKTLAPDGPVQITADIVKEDEFSRHKRRIHLFRAIVPDNICDDPLNSIFFSIEICDDVAFECQ